MKKRQESQYGFTLLEMAGVLLVSSVMASMGIPMAMDMKDSVEGSTLQDDFAKSLAGARLHALSTGAVVSVCGSDDGKACKEDAWSNGWLVYEGKKGVEGEVVDESRRLDSVLVESSKIEISVFDEKLKEVSDIRFNDQGFNVAKQLISAEVCSSGKNLSSESVSVARSGRIQVLIRADNETRLKKSCG